MINKILLSVSLCISAYSMDYTAGELEKFCKSDNNLEKMYCHGFFDSYFLFHVINGHELKNNNPIAFADVISPSNLNQKQAIRIYLKYINDNPKFLNQPSTSVITDSLIKAFNAGYILKEYK